MIARWVRFRPDMAQIRTEPMIMAGATGQSMRVTNGMRPAVRIGTSRTAAPE